MTLEAELKKLSDLREVEITFGIHETEGSKQYAKTTGSQTVAEIANAHEHGLGVPKRSWLRGYVDSHARQISDDTQKAIKLGIERGNPALIFEGLALVQAGKMQANFAKGIGPALAPKTVAKKGSSLQLVDQGIMRSSITGESKLV